VDAEYISLDEALKELGISEADLRAMITRGQLNVSGEGGEERFSRSDIESLKRATEGQRTIVPEDEPLPIIGDEEPLPLVEEEPTEPGVEPEPLFAEDDSPTEMPLLADEDDVSAPTDTVMPTIEFSPDEAIPVADEEHTDVATQEVSLADEDYLILEEDKAPTSAMDQPGEFAPEEGAEEEPEAEGEPVIYEEAVTPHGAQTFLLAALSLLMLVSMAAFVGATIGNMSEGVRTWLINTGNTVGLVSDDSVSQMELQREAQENR